MHREVPFGETILSLGQPRDGWKSGKGIDASFAPRRPFCGRSSSSLYDPDLTFPATYPGDRENLDRHLTRAPSHARANSRSVGLSPGQPKRRNVVKVTNGRARAHDV